NIYGSGKNLTFLWSQRMNNLSQSQSNIKNEDLFAGSYATFENLNIKNNNFNILNKKINEYNSGLIKKLENNPLVKRYNKTQSINTINSILLSHDRKKQYENV